MTIQTIQTKAEFVALLHDVDTDPKGWSARQTQPIVVDFYADWCQPCRALSPLLEQIAQEYDGRIQVYKVNVDDNPELTALYNIRTIPTLLFAHPSDTAPTTMLGVMGIQELRTEVERLLINR